MCIRVVYAYSSYATDMSIAADISYPARYRSALTGAGRLGGAVQIARSDPSASREATPRDPVSRT